MNRKLIILLAMLIIGLMTSVLNAVSATQYARRIVEVNDLGLVYVYDEVPSNGEKTIIRFPRALIKNLVNYASPDDPEPELKVDEAAFFIIIDSRPGDVVHLVTIFRETISWDSAKKSFELRMPLNPIIQIEEKIPFSIEIRLPGNASKISPEYLKQVSGGIISGTINEANLSEAIEEEFSVTFTSQSLRIIEINSAKLEVEPFERKMKLDLEIRHLGGEGASEITLKLPEKSSGIETRDHLGKIPNSYDAETGHLRVTLRQTLDLGQRAYLSLKFMIPENSSIIYIGDDELRMTPLLPLNTTSWVYEVEVVLRGVDPESWAPEPDEFYKEYPDKSVLTYQFSHIDPINIHNNAIDMRYRRVFAVSAVLPYLAMIAVVGVLGSITAIYARGMRKVPSRGRGPIQELIDEGELLIPIYQGLSDLISSGRIFERGYSRKRLLELRSGVRRHVEKLAEMGRELRRTGPEISRELMDLENAAYEFQKTVEKSWDIAYPYLSGGLSRKKLAERLDEYYEELKSSYSKFADCLDSVRRRLK